MEAKIKKKVDTTIKLKLSKLEAEELVDSYHKALSLYKNTKNDWDKLIKREVLGDFDCVYDAEKYLKDVQDIIKPLEPTLDAIDNALKEAETIEVEEEYNKNHNTSSSENYPESSIWDMVYNWEAEKLLDWIEDAYINNNLIALYSFRSEINEADISDDRIRDLSSHHFFYYLNNYIYNLECDKNEEL